MADGGALALEAWRLVRRMMDDMTAMVEAEAETELELLEGLRVLGRITALCSELSLDVDADSPWFFSMNTEARLIGGPNPDGQYFLAMIDGHHRYRVSGCRGTTAYLGFQVLAGSGLTPRRMGAYVSDRDLSVADDGSFAFVLAAEEPTAPELAGHRWVAMPADSSAIVVREYIADRTAEEAATLVIEPLDPPGRPAVPTDGLVAEQLTSMAWTIAKLATLHRTIRPELLDTPNQLVTALAADLGEAETTPDNLYMMGTFRLALGQALVIDLVPPDTRYWSVTLENIWHECIDPRRRRSSLTNAHAVSRRDGTVRIVIADTDTDTDTDTVGAGASAVADGDADPDGIEDAVNRLDTGGRHRGFVVIRWLDNPEPPSMVTSVRGPASVPS